MLSQTKTVWYQFNIGRAKSSFSFFSVIIKRADYYLLFNSVYSFLSVFYIIYVGFGIITQASRFFLFSLLIVSQQNNV